jgi:hypothetical protein
MRNQGLLELVYFLDFWDDRVHFPCRTYVVPE